VRIVHRGPAVGVLLGREAEIARNTQPTKERKTRRLGVSLTQHDSTRFKEDMSFSPPMSAID